LQRCAAAGTDPHYKGLYAAPNALVRPSAEELDRVSANFPEVATVADLAQLMVGIDRHWENLKLVRAAGWKTPANHADLDPPHEALQLVEHYREASRLPNGKARPEEFKGWLTHAEEKAKILENVLRVDEDKKAIQPKAAEEAFRRAEACCTRCHSKYRDVPR
jgi:hypothetical protein